MSVPEHSSTYRYTKSLTEPQMLQTKLYDSLTFLPVVAGATGGIRRGVAFPPGRGLGSPGSCPPVPVGGWVG